MNKGAAARLLLDMGVDAALWCDRYSLRRRRNLRTKHSWRHWKEELSVSVEGMAYFCTLKFSTSLLQSQLSGS